MQQVSPPKNPVLVSASQRATGAEAEGRVICRGDSAAKAAEGSRGGCRHETRANNMGDPPGAIGVARGSTGAHEEPAQGVEGASTGCQGDGIGDGRHRRSDVTDGGRKQEWE